MRRILPALVAGLLLGPACGTTDPSEPGPDAGTGTGVGSDAGHGSCEAPTPSVPLPGTSAVDSNARDAELELSFDDPIADPTASVDGPGSATVEPVDDRSFRVRVSGLVKGEPSVLRLSARAACGDPVWEGETRIEIEVQPWELVGPIGEVPPVEPPETPWFVEVSEEAGFSEPSPDTRAMLADVDGDGFDDLVRLPVTALPLQPVVLRNLAGDGGFGFATFETGLEANSATLLLFGDVDEDGDQDALSFTGARSPEGQQGVWLNDGSGRFSYDGDWGIASAQLGATAFEEPAAATLADLDGDGRLDLYLGRWYTQVRNGNQIGSAIPRDDQLYHNVGGAFEAVTLPEQLNPLTRQANRLLGSPRSEGSLANTGRAAYGLATGDYDGDGDLDLFVNNYGAGRPAFNSPPWYWDHNFLWRNDGDMRFVDVGVELGVAATRRGTMTQDEAPLVFSGVTMPAPIGGNGFGCEFADFDADGDLDLIAATIAHPDYPQSDRTLLWVNEGGSFTEESQQRGLEWAEDEIHPHFVDVDQDGRMELAMSRLRNTKMEFYAPTADGNFVRQDYATTGVDIGRPGPTLWTDLDGDGDLDFFMPKGAGRVFRNDAGNDRNWLKFDLVANGPRDATGAQVTMETSAGTPLRQVVAGQGHYNVQPSRTLHFPLGNDPGGREVTIRWPNGQIQVLGNVRANLRLRVEQGGGVTIVSRR